MPAKKSFLKSFAYAFNGLRLAWQQRNFKVHALAATLILIACKVFAVSTYEWLAVIICIAVVMTAEIINTAIEKTCDLITIETHPQIKLIKDLAAGAVLLAAIISAIIAAVIFIPRIAHLL